MKRNPNSKQQPGRKAKEASWRIDPSGKQFINPYNFVRLGKVQLEDGSYGVARSSYSEDDCLSGAISCTLRAITPLSIPDASSLPAAQIEGEEHKGAGLPSGVPFFRTPRRMSNGSVQMWPTIPGSEIRGVIRSAFEALDNGCLSVNNSNIASARSTVPFQPAILEGRWIPDGRGGHSWEGYLYKAVVAKRAPAGEEAIERTWLEFGNPAKRKTSWFKRRDEVKVEQDELTRAVLDYLEVVDLYMDNSEKHRNTRKLFSLVPKPPRKPLEEGRKGAWPLFFDIAGTLDGDFILYLSPAQITRRVFRKRVDDLLGGDANGSHKHCDDTGNCCEPCRMFGFVGKDGALASRIRFTDAAMVASSQLDCSGKLQGNVMLKELSGPKTSAVEFYTKRPLDNDEPASAWTYDSAVFYEGGKPVDKWVKEGSSMQVLGRKFYLHHHKSGSAAAVNEAIVRSASTQIATKRNMTTELAKAGSEFSFEVFFDGISERQLDKLVWTLCIGENEMDGIQLHKIGHGKSLGLGSAKILVDSVWVRDSRTPGKPAAMEERSYGAGVSCEWPDPGVVSDYLAITNWNLTEGLEVCYPLADDLSGSDNSKASHQWFAGNRTLGEHSTNDMNTRDVYRALPALPDMGGITQERPDGSVLLLPRLVKDQPSDNHVRYRKVLEHERTCAPEFARTERPKPLFEERGAQAPMRDAVMGKQGKQKERDPLRGSLNQKNMDLLAALKAQLAGGEG